MENLDQDNHPTDADAMQRLLTSLGLPDPSMRVDKLSGVEEITVVRHHQYGHARTLQVALKPFYSGNVEVVGRLVEYQQFGVAYSFGVDEGEKIGIVARNGTGKSTLLRILAGEESPDDGKVVYRREFN